jgi:hypothetical protein
MIFGGSLPIESAFSPHVRLLEVEQMMVSKNLFVASILILLTGCSDQQIQSNWARRSPTIDGNLEEWSNASMVVFEDVQVSIGVGNDTSFLYLAGRIANASLQQMVERSGIVIWLDPEGGHQKGLEIHFPASRVARANLNRGEFWDSMTEDQKARARKEVEEMGKGVLVIDRRSVNSQVYKPGNVEGFAGVISESKGLISFEVRIPLQIEKHFQKFRGLDPGRSVMIGVGLGASIGNLSGNVDFNGAPPMGESGFPGRGGSPGNFLGGGSQVPKDKEVWLEVSLARLQ